jgi:hypothetical protein
MASGDKILVGSNFNFKNKIINGDFSIWQRGTSFSTSTANDLPYTADRWKIGYHPEDAEVTVEQAEFGLKFTNNQTSDNSSIKQLIEPNIMPELLSNNGIYYYTLSYLMKNENLETDYSTLSAIAFRVEYTDGTSYQFPATVGTNGDKQTWLITVDTNNIDYTKTIYAFSVELYLKPSTTYIYEVQLEKGKYATEFEVVPYDIQLMRCLRYYEQGRFVNQRFCGSASNYGNDDVKFYVRKRTIPSMKIAQNNFANCSYLGVQVMSEDSFHVNVTTSEAIDILIDFNFEADAEL